jgi:hypothetical protein
MPRHLEEKMIVDKIAAFREIRNQRLLDARLLEQHSDLVD